MPSKNANNNGADKSEGSPSKAAGKAPKNKTTMKKRTPVKPRVHRVISCNPKPTKQKVSKTKSKQRKTSKKQALERKQTDPAIEPQQPNPSEIDLGSFNREPNKATSIFGIQSQESVCLSAVTEDVSDSDPLAAHLFHDTYEQPRVSSALDPTTDDRSAQGFIGNIGWDIREIFDYLNTEIPHTELPQMEAEENYNATSQESLMFTARHLFQLYIYAYHQKQWNICDLISDIWIRTFQEKDADENRKMWKKNKFPYHTNDEARASIPEPTNDNGYLYLHHKVVQFNNNAINELYAHTMEKCGARMVWADAMALCGGEVEEIFEEEGLGSWHQGLMREVMKTALRLVRVRRTLKIEQKHPEAWCKRYHEHEKHGRECYRVLAREGRALREEILGQKLVKKRGGRGGKRKEEEEFRGLWSANLFPKMVRSNGPEGGVGKKASAESEKSGEWGEKRGVER
ncbi:uncharacterized protein BDR25DRAFT_315113 [Lindgomyces ingoldianus]|uniref:Uncharacterized protein n=1 Tax=Lindgomyces ingoldianus TaxID=673940 RepID=A0ACB6QUY0_9PLEO|nr:uncharacterized protein BDR25DRAFT_315113 [Lindgomyces ingoldianus]KAF2469895.1 hypothetical protein BDR25DRAFT_315113 [Lindgomyces ingoldianus]